MRKILGILATISGLATLPAWAQESPFTSVAELKSRHDRDLIRALDGYIGANPKADDLEQAYMTLFDTVIEHDWFLEHEAIARRYLADFPGGAVRSLAQIVTTMARAEDGKFSDALTAFSTLLDGLEGPEQEEFAVDFADNLASAAAAVGEVDPARRVYELLLRKYGDSPALRQKVRDDLERIDRIGRPAPRIAVKDLNGKLIRLEDFRGKLVLVDFWATWCAPCVAELPRIQKAYQAYRDRGFEVIAISLDETRQPLVDFVQTRKIPWIQVHNEGTNGDAVDAFGISTIPSSFLIGRDGNVLRIDLRGKLLDETLAKLISEGEKVGAPKP